MKASKFLSLLVAICALSGGSANAATTIQFYEPYFGGIADNLANSAGVATNGMRWGIIVDTTGNGFSSTYSAYASGTATAGFFNSNGTATDDYYIPGALTVNGSVFPASDNGTTPGDGSILDDLAVNYLNGVSSNDKFALIWFNDNTSANNSQYGFFTDASFVLPADTGATAGFTGPFAGTDPIRSASNTFQAVPEPSRLIVLGFGVVGLIVRRRRK